MLHRTLDLVTFEDVDWIYLAQDSAHWQTLVNMVRNNRVPYKVGNFLTC